MNIYIKLARYLKKPIIFWLFNFSREKTNRKALQDAVKEFSFICRGLIEVDPYTES
jgi:hypothetical protein